MDTAQIKCDFLWLGHSLLTVKGDDNQEVAEKLKPELYTKYNHLTSVLNRWHLSHRADVCFLLKVNYAFGLSANVGIPKPRQP